jgi:hypothetical protein
MASRHGMAQSQKRLGRHMPAPMRAHAHGAVTAQWPRARWRGGTPAEGSPTAAAEEGLHGSLERRVGKAPAKVKGHGAHPNGATSVEGAVVALAAVFPVGGDALVVLIDEGGVL